MAAEPTAAEPTAAAGLPVGTPAAPGPPPGRPITRLLVANRGEVARRILRAARDAGIETVAVFAEDDRHAPYVAEADRAVPLGAGPPAATYLDVAALVAAAERAGADALHPGYGFRSEDPALAEACLAAGLVWVGPPPAALAAMAHKARAKATVAAAGVPVLPGSVVGPDDAADRDRLLALGAGVGYPLLVKASAGGGGRGMRVVADPGELAGAVAAAGREAAAAFGSADVFLERYVASPRHVEVQVLADRHGHVVHLYDRECSVQRRHQKLVEEAPASCVPTAVRREMWEASVAAARAVGYEGAGTVEFVVDGDRCAFLEMNARLQVEHGVTELVTGLDLVGLQLAVAAGRPLPFTQDEVRVRGHAVEVRLCAERPSDDHRPAPGPVLHARWPRGTGIRVDAAVESGSAVGAAYDSLVAKVMAVGPDRDRAVARLRQALGGPLELDGLVTNRDLLAAVLAEGDFLAGRTSTGYLERHPAVVGAVLPAAVRRRHAAAASLFLEGRRTAASVVPGAPPSWRNVGRAQHQDRYVSPEGERISVTVARPRGRLEVVVEGPGDLAAPLGQGVAASVGPVEALAGAGAGGTGAGAGRDAGAAPGAAEVMLEVDGVVAVHRVRDHGELLAVSSAEGQSTLHLAAEAAAGEGTATAGECRAPLPGSVTRVLVSVGDRVDAGAALVVVEAMKMEHTLRAAGHGTVREVRATAGLQVAAGDLLVVTEPEA